MDLSNPKIEISNQLRARCCGRVAQFELHIASGKKILMILLLPDDPFCSLLILVTSCGC